MGQKKPPHRNWFDKEAVLYRYRDLLGWPVTADADNVTLQAGDTVCTVDLPVGLASVVQDALRVRMLDGPVVLVPGRQHRWMLLAAPSEQDTASLWSVPGVQLRVIREGPIKLPPSKTRHGPLQWVVPPSLSRPRVPPLSAIIDATRAAVSVRRGYGAVR